DGDSADSAIRQFDFAGVKSGADLETDVADCGNDGLCAADRAGRPIKSGEEAVTGGIDLAAAEARKLVPDRGVMTVEQLSPAAIAERARTLRRPDDVCEQESHEHTIGLFGLAHAGQELLDLVGDLCTAA